jgi:5-methylcytosine-specific restriction endonuclease McrA
MRQRVYQRDKGVCARCGVDTAVLGNVLAAEWERVKMARTAPERREREAFRKRYRWYFSRTSYWDADHIKPVSEGGGECSLDNMRTLCVPCHQVVTRELAKRTASHRRQRRAGFASIRVYLEDDPANA